MARQYPTHIRQAFDELRFGDGRTLNLRQWLPSADEARAWVERWLRTKQMERAGDVLVITGRGNNSPDGHSAVRHAIVGLFPSLRRRNVIAEWREHTPGSFVVTLASVNALFDTPKRRRERDLHAAPLSPSALNGLGAETLAMLRRLAETSLAALGVHETDPFLQAEMLSAFATLTATLDDDVEDHEAALKVAIRQALDELDDSE